MKVNGNIIKFVLILLGYIGASGCNSSCTVEVPNASVSGEIIEGLRVIELSEHIEATTNFTVYRGDYVVFLSPAGGEILEIPDLQVLFEIGKSLEADKKIKMTNLGNYPTIIDGENGLIHVIDFAHPQYEEISSKNALEVIQNLTPIILDVRTPPEFQSGHINQAQLIPVQELQARIHELENHKNETILVYCRSGNRSTVASKLLIDSGFKRVYNLRDGINGWMQEKHNLVK